jgi:Arc/MetJ-type ribon-helix-helix transcriptional regulator
MAIKIARLTVRVSKEESAHIAELAKQRGYLSPSAFVRTAIRNEIAGRDAEIGEAEQRIAATLEGLSRDILRANRGHRLSLPS